MGEKISRKDFVKKLAVGITALGLFGKSSVANAGTYSISDNLQTETRVGTVAPTNTDCLWVDTRSGQGILRYYDGVSWVPTVGVWG